MNHIYYSFGGDSIENTKRYQPFLNRVWSPSDSISAKQLQRFDMTTSSQ